MSSQLDLLEPKPASPRVDWLLKFLLNLDWVTASEILKELGQPVTEDTKRQIRAMAAESRGQICGHQKGYKRCLSMTNEEYQWWRNEMLKQARSITARVVESDKVFYRRQPIPKPETKTTACTETQALLP